VLLLVHGTFSSTIAAFAPMGLVPGAEGFLPTVLSTYDAVIGYDHRTLSVDPRQNAVDLLTELRRHHPGTDLTIDIITHSRGGLVTRSFVEAVLPQSNWPAVVDNIVFVASTNGGTHLADPARWHDLIDLYTNLVTVGAAGLALVPGGAPVGAVVGGVVRGLGALVKYLVSYAAESDDVPGLAAMIPGGAFVTDLNGDQPGQPSPGTNWHVVSSNFHVSLLDDSHRPPEFPKELVVRLGEGFVDGLFEGDNDLVVDTASMSAIGPPSGGYVKDTLAFGTNDEVYHTNYFSQLRVIEAIAGWLSVGMGVGGGPESGAEPADSGADRALAGADDTGLLEVALESPSRAPGRRARVTASRPPTALSPPLPTTTAPAPRKGATKKATARKATARKATARKARATSAAADEGAPTSPGQLAAEMPATVVPEQDFTVRVRLGTSAIEASRGTVSVSAGVQVDAGRPVSIQVVGKQNARIVGVDSKPLGLPQGDWTSDAQFTARALEAGPVRITVIARQGWVPVANLTLEGEAVSAARTGVMPLTATSHASARGVFGIDAAGLERLPVLEIFERRVTGGRVIYQYAVRATPRGKVRHFESPPLTRSEQFAAKRIAQIADIWRNTRRSAEERFSDVQDIGVDFFERLFPEEMQEFLWERRDKLGNLLVLTDEPYMPWEIVHLKPPRGEREQEPRFLAQGGLVRWHFDRVPPQHLRVRPGRARSLCPVYEDPAFALSGPEQEAHFLEERFGATPIRPTPRAVRSLLRGGGFDLLHFAGHGAADAATIEDARILLAAGRRDGEELQEYLSATNVSANAAWTRKGEVGPVVVLNACEVGQSGTQLSTVGGFAKAFLDAGASAFVSCLWSVRDEPSRIFVEALYDELLKGATVAEASARARAVARAAGDETWLAYVVYARPDAVLATGPDQPTADLPLPGSTNPTRRPTSPALPREDEP
jgi:biotin carboxyl carrier protein